MKRSIAASQVLSTQTDRKQEEASAKEGDGGKERRERETMRMRRREVVHTDKKRINKTTTNGCTHLYPEPKHRKQHSLQMSRLLTDESQSQTGSVPLKSDT